jgi:hypothetical protein
MQVCLCAPVVGQACHRVHAGQADRRLVTPELVRRLRVAFGGLLSVGARRVALGQALLPVGLEAGEQCPHECQDGERCLDDVQGVDAGRAARDLNRDGDALKADVDQRSQPCADGRRMGHVLDTS